ncbi:hypothetical protein L3V83_09630 [Thiotrichales bacterium 19X7-9]|nr:hypothetical protein [Thiotrichales bacterium 19X7-9]
MPLSIENKQKIINFLLNTDINNDDEVNEIFLDIYKEIAKETSDKHPEIELNSEKYFSTVIPEINDRLVEYLKNEHLFDDIYPYYHKLRHSVSQWAPEGKYMAEIPKLAPFQGSLLEILDDGLIEKYASKVDETKTYVLSLAKADRVKADEHYRKIAALFKRLEPAMLLFDLYPAIKNSEIISYRERLIKITLDYLLNKKFQHSEVSFQKLFAANNAVLIAFLKESFIFENVFDQYHKIRASLVNYSVDADNFKDIPDVLPICETLHEQLNCEIILNYASSPEKAFEFLSKLTKAERSDVFDKIAKFIEMLEPVTALISQKQTSIDSEIIQYRDHMIATVVNCLTIEKEEGFEGEYKKSILAAERAFKDLINDNLHFKIAEAIYPWIPNQKIALGLTNFSHTVTVNLPFFSYFSTSRYSLTQASKEVIKELDQTM